MISFNPAKSPKGNIMQIGFSKGEYRTLLEIIEIADWVLFAHRTDEPENRKKYCNFTQKIFSFAEALGFGNLIMYDKEMKRYFPTREHDENSPVRPFIEEFEEATFWDELVDRLAERDMLHELGEKKLLSMTREQRFRAYFDFEERYQKEFEKHGIEMLEVRE
jgi:hypothetical protein